jgi:predicted TIM-barrel fold metal-dependent hydrolase
MSGTSAERLVVISTDGHCGADILDYKPYLEKRYREEFDDWAANYYDPWGEVEADRPANQRRGTASFKAPLSWESGERLAYTEEQGIAAEVLFPNTSPPFIPSGSISAPGPRSQDEYEHRMAGLRAHNRWLVDFCADAPGRRAGIAQIFLDDVEAAIEEVRWAKEAGLMGVLLPGDHTLKMANLYYPWYDPLWEVCADLDIPVHRHGVTQCESAAEGGDAAPWIASLEAAFYHTRAIPHMLLAGVFERYPNLKFVTTEALVTAGLPRFLGTLDGMYEAARDGLTFDAQSMTAASKLNRAPSEYFASNCYLGGPLDLRASYNAGTPNVMFGADLPHGEGTSPYTSEALRCMLAGLSEDTVRNITSLTAAQVYGFDLDLLAKVAARIGPTYEEINSPLPASEWPAFPQATRCPTFAKGERVILGAALTSEFN